MTLFGFNVVEAFAPLPVVDVSIVGAFVLCVGEDVLILIVGDGALFACPFLAVMLGFSGRRGISLSRAVGLISSSSETGRDF